MPLTGYSNALGKELDVEQLFKVLYQDSQHFDNLKVSEISSDIRSFISQDIHCPICFVKGAEVVSGARSKNSGIEIRQAYFRFSIPGHRKFCDYLEHNNLKKTPDSTIDFGLARNDITRTIRKLVCSAIELEIINHLKIRDMREWFYSKKESSSFTVSLPPLTSVRFVEWRRELGGAKHYGLPVGIELSKEITKMPRFNWRLEAKRQLFKNNSELFNVIDSRPFWRLSFFSEKVQALAEAYKGKEVFDPGVLEQEYELTVEFARFVSQQFTFSDPYKPWSPKLAPVLAFCALLLYINDWDITRACEDYAKVVSHENPDPTLGNVMGLNPFHDFEAWRCLKSLQNLPDHILNIDDFMESIATIEQKIRASFND